MTDFATDLLWEEAKQPALPVPGRPHDRQHTEKPVVAHPAPALRPESLSERLQRVAGNAALAHEAEEAAAARKRLEAAAQHPEKVPTSSPAVKPEPAKPKEKHEVAAVIKVAANPKAPIAEREKAGQRQVAMAAMAVEARRLPEAIKAAAVRTAALAQVLAAFDHDAGKADVLTLALLVEKAPPGIAEATAQAIVRTVMRAEPAQRAAITARIKAQLGGRRDLRLARLLADRLGGLRTAVPPHAAPAPPPPAPPH